MFQRSFLLIVAILLAFASCKKSDTKTSPTYTDKIQGWWELKSFVEYTVTNGDTLKAQIYASTDGSSVVRFYVDNSFILSTLIHLAPWYQETNVTYGDYSLVGDSLFLRQDPQSNTSMIGRCLIEATTEDSLSFNVFVKSQQIDGQEQKTYDLMGYKRVR